MLINKKSYFSLKITVCIAVSTLFFCTPYSNGGVGLFELNNPYWYILLDQAGYSDICYWFDTPRHPYGPHEMMTGDWAAAIYYDGIAGQKAMWLTDSFIVPDWPTGNNFSTISYQAWNDPSNPIWENPNDPPYWPYNPADKCDTAQSIISNGQVYITIDYEMVDLAEQGPNGEGGSPMAFGSFQGRPAFVYSERYVLLQTYTITNITANPLTNLEFYQMLHGHPANEMADAVYSVYETAYYDGPLSEFRYDITQWNDPWHPDAEEDHQDWIGFSSTVEPTVAPYPIENGFYEGHGSVKPSSGTHISIEDRSLNGDELSFGQVAGAMGWYLGTLDPDESVSLTVAIMFGAGPIQRSPCISAEPVAHWRFDEGSGTTISDLIGDNDGTLVGNPTWVGGYSGQIADYALNFNGNDDYVKLSNPIGALTSDSVTISAWVKPASGLISTYYPIVTQYRYNEDEQIGAGYYLSLHGYKPDFYLNDNCSIEYSSSIDTDWHWVVGTYDGQHIKIYVDGNQEGSDAPGYSGIYTDAYIGAGGVGDEGRFEGAIDNVWVYVCAWEPEQDCLPICHEDYHEWVEMSRPDCWCASPIDGTHYQCYGDADGKTETLAKFRIYGGDLSLVVANWKRKIDDPLLNRCADIDHHYQTILKYRVYGIDVNTVVDNWKKKDYELTNNCNECDRGQKALGGGEVRIEELLKRLLEIWVDPEVRKLIDEDAWLKFVESLKQDIESPSLDWQQ
jgi:hypothetical protein